MEPVIYKNGEFMEIVIPANTEFTSEMLLSKYGIHADVQFVDEPMTGGGTLTYPYAFFHWFFSIFSLRPNVKDAPTTIGTKDVETKDESKDETKDETSIGETNDAETPIDKTNDETKDDTNVETHIDDTNVDIKDDTPIGETKYESKDDTPIDKSSNDTKYIKITIQSIDGVRSW